MTSSPSRPGRKRDPGRDAEILDAALGVLAETGYDRMTIDLVAARAGAARATVYRRWPTKADLVVGALGRLSAVDIDPAALPDTGSLRGDMLATVQPHSTDEQELRVRVLTAVSALARTEPRLAEAATGAGIAPWVEANRILIQRAIDRGEFPPADVDTISQVIPMMSFTRAVQGQPITRAFGVALIDHVVLPALRNN